MYHNNLRGPEHCGNSDPVGIVVERQWLDKTHIHAFIVFSSVKWCVWSLVLHLGVLAASGRPTLPSPWQEKGLSVPLTVKTLPTLGPLFTLTTPPKDNFALLLKRTVTVALGMNPFFGSTAKYKV